MENNEKYEPGSLIRTVYPDEYRWLDSSGDILDMSDVLDILNDVIDGLDGIRAVFNLPSIRQLENSVDYDEWLDSNTDKWCYIPFGTVGIVLKFFEAKNTVWQKILINEKTVWTEAYNLVKLLSHDEAQNAIP